MQPKKPTLWSAHPALRPLLTLCTGRLGQQPRQEHNQPQSESQGTFHARVPSRAQDGTGVHTMGGGCDPTALPGAVGATRVQRTHACRTLKGRKGVQVLRKSFVGLSSAPL